MHRAVLQACLPWFAWLCLASVVAILMVQYCGGRIDWRRLRQLRRCEEGAVHSLSLVLTLPVFLMLILFIVQISQIMVGLMMVHYAAFAGARAASVWIPSEVVPIATFTDDPARVYRQVPEGLEPANVVAGNINSAVLLAGGFASLTNQNGAGSVKYQKVVQAAVIPLLTISPSRRTGNGQLPTGFQATYDALVKIYGEIDPKSRTNGLMPQRLKNKLSYAAQFTTVELGWQNVRRPWPDVMGGPTYNPFMHPVPWIPRWNPNEIGFRDPITVEVRHQFALLPGIGRILATRNKTPGVTDPVAGRIGQQKSGGEDLYWVELKASATFVNEGYKSVLRYAVQP